MSPTCEAKPQKESIIMDKKEKDIALFVAFCIEEYKTAKGMSGEQVYDLFTHYGVIVYLSQCFEPLQSQGPQWQTEEIDEVIEIRTKKQS